MITIFRDTFKGDKYADEIFKDFFTKFLDKFCTKYLIKDGVLKALLEDVTKTNKYLHNILDNEDFDCDKIDELLKEVAEFTKDYLKGVDKRIYLEHYEVEWKKKADAFPDERSYYYIAQYNSILMEEAVKAIIKLFVRDQMYKLYQVGVEAFMKDKGQAVWMTSTSGIDQYGIYDPYPTYSGVERDDRLTTRQPDIAILQPLFEKYQVIEFRKKDGEDWLESRYKGYDGPRVLGKLNNLKYAHLNMGEQARRVLNFETKQFEYSQDAGERRVVGNWL